MIRSENELRGHNFSKEKEGFIIYEVLPLGSEAKYRLFQNYSIDTGIKVKKAIKAEFVELMTTGKLHLKKGLLSDGITGFPDFIKGMRSAFIHDPLVGLIIRKHLNEKHLPKVNDLFKKTCLEDKVKPWLAKILRFCLKLIGKKHIKRMIEKEDDREAAKKLVSTLGAKLVEVKQNPKPIT